MFHFDTAKFVSVRNPKFVIYNFHDDNHIYYMGGTLKKPTYTKDIKKARVFNTELAACCKAEWLARAETTGCKGFYVGMIVLKGVTYFKGRKLR